MGWFTEANPQTTHPAFSPDRQRYPQAVVAGWGG